MKAAVEHIFTGPTGSISGSYDSTKTLLGSLMKQYTGNTLDEKYVSTNPSAIINQVEVAGLAYTMPHVIQYTDDIFWVFVTAQAPSITRNVGLYEFNKLTSTISWKGFITISGTTFAGTKTPRGLRGFVYKHTTGTVSTSGASTTITGDSTGFQSERIAVGARIGFNTTDPNDVTTWYEITAINSNTELVISSPVNLSLSTTYVIEEIRIALATTNSLTTIINGGVTLIKGLNYNTFTLGGTTIPEASLSTPTNVDNIRASYLLKDPLINGAPQQTCTFTSGTPGTINVNNHGLVVGDLVVFTTTGTLPVGITAASTIYYVTPTNLTTNTFTVSVTLGGVIINIASAGTGIHTVNSSTAWNPCGLGSDDFISNSHHDLYLVHSNNATSVRIIKYNLRAPLTVISGYSTSAFIFKTNNHAIVGTASQVNNGRIFTASHGAANGVKSLWFVTTNRIYRCTLSGITPLATGWISDFMIEIPPGTSTTYSALSTMSQIDYSETIDRIFIPTTSGRFGVYIGTYDTTGLIPFEKIIGTNINRLKLSTTPSGAVDGLFPQAAVTVWTEGGYMFVIPNTAVSGLNWLYIFPIGADSTYAANTNQRIITPKLATPNASKLYRAYVDHAEYIGDYGLGIQPEAYKLYFRTSGIDDNSGSWTEVGRNGDLTSQSPNNFIQFMFELDVLGEVCVPTKIYGVSCVYEDGSQDSHYEPSLTKSSAQNRQFAWRQTALWGGTIPNLRMRLFNVATNTNILDDNITTSAYGVWQYSTDGISWLAWDSSADVIGNYIRYTVDGGVIGNLITVRALLTQN